jgi:hypothetical protein
MAGFEVTTEGGRKPEHISESDRRKIGTCANGQIQKPEWRVHDAIELPSI